VSIVITKAVSRTASAGRLGQVRALGREHARFVGGAVPHAYLKARLQQVARHRRAHSPDAENRDLLSHQPVTVSAVERARR
jgi:hypothetical protein